jgi:glyoxylase-like metal-dependent hydrolase (beta-lactamase superfamily II)
MSRFAFTKGLHDIGDGAFAYLQPDGGLGLSNAGLLVDGDKSILVDTLMDLPLTREMLAAMQRATPAAGQIDVLVNTHANLDHTFGNQLVKGAEIIASADCAREMLEDNPPLLKSFQNPDPNSLQGRLLQEAMGQFDFRDIVITPPTRTFEGERLSLPFGDRTVEVIHVGPAHTKGDVIVHSPKDKAVFTGDIVFIGTHPVIWAGPWSKWIAACELILGLDAEVIVPGHGPIVDKAGVRQMLDWIVYLRDEAKKRYDAGLTVEETVRDIDVYEPIAKWIDADRIVSNVNLLFGEFGGGPGMITSLEEHVAVVRRLGLGHRRAEGCDAHENCDGHH